MEQYYQGQKIKTYQLFSARTAGLAFLLALVLPQLIGGAGLAVISLFAEPMGDFYLFSAFLLTQGSIFLAVMIAVGFKWERLKDSAHANMAIDNSDYRLAFPTVVACTFGLSILANIFFFLLGLTGYSVAESVLPNMSSFVGFFWSVVCICILPAICEELLFRGVILRSFKRSEAWKGILVSAGLFALMHGSAEQTVYQFAMGVLLGLIAVKSNSIFPCMLVHFVNNLFTITIYLLPVNVLNWVYIFLLVPGIVASFLLFRHQAKRHVPYFLEENEKSTMPDMRMHDEDGNFIGMHPMAGTFQKVEEDAKKKQAIIFYACGIAFGSIAWLYSLFLGYGLL